MSKFIVFVLAIISLAAVPAASAVSMDEVITRLESISAPQLGDWKYLARDVPGAEQPDFDDSAWKSAKPEFSWGPSPTAWFRKTVIIPEKMGGFPIAGTRVSLRVAVDDGGIIYLNGKEVSRFDWNKGQAVLTEKAVPGDRIVIAIKGLNTIGDGRLMSASFDIENLSDLQSRISAYLEDVRFAMTIPGDSKEVVESSLAKIDLDAMQAGDAGRLVTSLDEADKAMAPLQSVVNGYTAHLVGHAHIDMNWLWLWPETVDVCKNTFSTVNKLMDEFPEFHFSQSQPSTYVAVQEADPALFRKMQERVKQGRWEITGGTWVEGDMNMASGEAITRQILYAKKYFRENFGVEPKICWEPDTFGHAWTIPQILKKSEIDYYYFTRCGKENKPLFWWEGPDGSRVLAFNDDGYSGDLGEGIASEMVGMAAKYGVKDDLVVYGVGDHGGGPTREMINRGLALRQRKLFPKLEFSTALDYFKAVEPFGKNFPVINDELNFVFQGCYTTHSDIKLMNRTMENLLPTAETFSAITSTRGSAYPFDAFLDAWHKTCFNQFHDIFDGSAIHESYDYSRQLFDKAFAEGSSALDKSLQAIASTVDTRGKGIPVVVFNPLSWQRTDVVEMSSPISTEKTLGVEVSDGKTVYPAQLDGDKLWFTARDVPSLGYKTFWLRTTNGPGKSGVTGTDSIIENEFFRVTVDAKSGAIAGIYDKLHKREIVPNGQQADLLQVLTEKDGGMSAWNIGQITGTEDLGKAHDSELIETGPARATIRSEHHYGASSFVQDVTLHQGVPRIDIAMTADWREKGVAGKLGHMLKVAIPTTLNKPKATFEVPFGSIERPTNGDEVPAQKWIDLSDADYGVSLLNDCKYGHDVKDNVMRLTLLRSPADPDPIPDVGMHEMTYSIYPHVGTWQEAGTPRRGYELNNPLRALAVDAHAGKMPKQLSYVTVEPSNLIVTALKRSEDGEDLILRFYETDGKPTTAVITTKLPVKAFVETNLLERKVGKAQPASKRMKIPVGKYEIKTLRLVL